MNKHFLLMAVTIGFSAQTAFADVRLSGYGRFGLQYADVDNADSVCLENRITSRLRLQVDLSTETDGGVAFGARFRAAQENTDRYGYPSFSGRGLDKRFCTIDGFSVGGFVVAQHEFGDYGSQSLLGGQLDLRYAFPVQNGIIGFGGYATGLATNGYTDGRFDPYVFYKRGNYQITLGHTADAYSYIEPTYPEGLRYRPSIHSVFVPTIRIDANFGKTDISASYSENDWAALGVGHKFGDTSVYGAVAADLGGVGNYVQGTLGITHQLNDKTKLLAGITADNYDWREVKIAARYQVNDRLGLSSSVALYDNGFNEGVNGAFGVAFLVADHATLFADYACNRAFGQPANQQGIIGVRWDF